MNAGRRVSQFVWFAGLSVTAALVTSSESRAAEQPVWCVICTNTPCSPEAHNQIVADCEQICTAGSFIEYQCLTTTCTGQGGGTYSSRVRCLTDVP